MRYDSLLLFSFFFFFAIRNCTTIAWRFPRSLSLLEIDAAYELQIGREFGLPAKMEVEMR